MADLNGRVLAGKILVKPEEAKEKTEGGIIIPEVAKEKLSKGKVILVGEAKKDEVMDVKVGDSVFYGKFSGIRLPMNDVNYLLMTQDDILFIEE